MKKTLHLFFGLVVSPFLFGQTTTSNSSSLSEFEPSLETIFATFESTQEFVEDMYALVVSYELQSHTFQDYLLGDDGHVNRESKVSGDIDAGNLNLVLRDNFTYFNNHYNSDYGSTGTNSANLKNPNSFNKQRPGLWDGSIHGIRKANIVIQNIDLLVNATQAEKDVILGQSYFFRAFFHNEIMKFWGRFPYIMDVFDADEIEIAIPRPETYKEVALLAHEDYKKAAEFLPVDWDEEAYGMATLGENKNKLTKGIAYAFQGKNLLLAASPLMFYNNNSGINTYNYDIELCDMAVDAFAELFKLNKYSLASWESYDEVFWKTPIPDTWPGSTEFIFAAILGDKSQAQRFMTSGVNRELHGSISESISPTHNYIHYNFGMANGLSIEDDLSGNFGAPTYNPNKPFENRDPRFYKWHIIDGQEIAPKATGADFFHQFANLWYEHEGNVGIHRRGAYDNKKSTTGYMHTKFYPIIDGEYHSRWNPIIDDFNGVRLHMRLTDVYLMYAEALHASKGATTAPASYSLTAEGAINLLRNRAGIPNVHANILADNNKFMDELRRERAVEMSYEGHRWVDIRRWGVAHLERYRQKTQLNFPENHATSGGYQEGELVMRVCEYPKHYWLPFAPNRIKFAEGFPQNPGWENIVLSVKDVTNKENNLLVYPNPSSGIFKISENIKYSIYDITGRLIISGKGKTIDLSTQEKGVYFLRYNGNTKTIIKY
ncbi:RagB/SusD family nutrient uptake outer membrane protein [Cognatitamlana onchidii]|uniref:RagB/SusD family nutrient uptake outer membrane protein n=1 Tax=Cognatitamlana onchidii TaxID=2562860 RepID=UPI001455DE75|nr:RagB/SusD family nutrient uptake outer membrane protein [Algibacter onchidii]